MSDDFHQIKAEKPTDLSEFIGRTMTMMDGQRVKIETIVGSMVKPTRYEVNHAHHIVILDAYKQLNHLTDKEVSQEAIDLFDQMVVENIERVPVPKSAIEMQKVPNLPEMN